MEECSEFNWKKCSPGVVGFHFGSTKKSHPKNVERLNRLDIFLGFVNHSPRYKR